MLVHPGRLLTKQSSVISNAVAKGTLNADATFTRADPATYFDSDGLLQTAAAGEARTTYIDGVPYLWLDGAVTEISGRSADLDNFGGTATVTKDAVGLDGEANTGWTFTDNSDSSRQDATNGAVISSSTDDYYLVVMFKKNAAPSVFPRANMFVIGGTVVDCRNVLDPRDGSVVNISGSVVLSAIPLGDFFAAVLMLSDNGSGNTTINEQISPAYNTDGSGTQDVTAQGSSEFGYIGMFKDNFSLMPILTTDGTTKTVAADVASLVNSVISGLTEGTLYMEIWTPQLTSNAARHIAELESDANNFIRAFHAADGDLDAQITDGGASQAALAGTDLTVGQLQKVALAFSEDDFALYRDGDQIDTDSGGTVPSVDTLLIGAGLYGGIKTMNVYTSRLPNSQLVTLTT